MLLEGPTRSTFWSERAPVGALMEFELRTRG